MNDETHHAELRAWARGDRPLTAAVELLIRAGLAYDTAPWITYDRAWKTTALDFTQMTTMAGHTSGTEQAVLGIVASLGLGVPTNLRNDLTGLDHQQTALVMTAVAHAAGFTESTTSIDVNRIVPLPPLALWPE